ncbi:triacylglycerol lipase [Acrasis kona]|uniref:Triacylglycerol lipase n=1 Tax=Acrasis kona TaxID=1008807 RepID=A0AAW2Z0K2_9EUKA
MNKALSQSIIQARPIEEITSNIEDENDIFNTLEYPGLGVCSAVHVAVMTQNIELIQYIRNTSKSNYEHTVQTISSKTLQNPVHVAMELFSIQCQSDAINQLCNIILDEEYYISTSTINSIDAYGLSPLHTAIISNSPVTVIQKLISRGSNMLQAASFNQNVFHLCAYHSRADLFDYFLQQNRPEIWRLLNSSDTQFKQNPLHISASLGDLKLCQLIINKSQQFQNFDYTQQLLTSKNIEKLTPHLVARYESQQDCYLYLRSLLDEHLLEKIEHEELEQETKNEEWVRVDQSQVDKPYYQSIMDMIKNTNNITNNETNNSYKFNTLFSKWWFPSEPTPSEKTSPPSPPIHNTIDKNINSTAHDLERMCIFDHIKSQGYPIEKHETMTGDGFVLQMFRIPHGTTPPPVNSKETRPVVFLQHGVCNSGATWVVTGTKQGLAFLLAAAGFDVWLGNNRGVQFARKHIKHSESSGDFWAWSWQEMARYDFVSQINYVLDHTKSKQLSYVGHSQGTTQAFAAMCMFPFMQKKINLFVALAPVTRLSNQSSQLLKTLAALKSETILKTLGLGEIGSTLISRNFLPHAFRLLPQMKFDIWSICMDCDIDREALKILTAHEPSPTSVVNMAHWSQLVRSGKFEAFDYGPEKNLCMYGSVTPEEYDLTTVKVPVAIFYGDKDYLANVTDIEEFLVKKLPNVIHLEKVINFKHNDFVWGRTACDKVFLHMINLLGEYNKTKVDQEKVYKVEQQVQEQIKQDPNTSTTVIQ